VPEAPSHPSIDTDPRVLDDLLHLFEAGFGDYSQLLATYAASSYLSTQ
jgi:hypothetical protein